MVGKKKTEVKARTEYNVSAEDFVRAWQTSETTDEVVEKLGMPKPIVLARASTYREKGVILKKHRRHGRNIDVDGLNELIAELGANAQKEKS